MSELQMSVENEEAEMSELQTPIKTEKGQISDLQTPIEWEVEEEMSETEEILTFTPPELSETEGNLLPAKSRERYERRYRTFVKWCDEKNVSNYTEDVLLEYFRDLVSQNTKALWAIYSMLKACIVIHKNIDISNYSRLLAYLKSNTAHVKAKKSRALTEDQIDLFIDQADDREFLLMKVALIIGVSGALHREELYNITLKDLEFKADLLVITVPEATTNRCRQFVVMNTKWVALVQKYLQIRLKASKTKDRFFLKYQRGRCTTTPVGIKVIARIPSEIANFLNLDNCEEYTGHCFRRSSAALLTNRSHLPTLKKKSGGSKSYTENFLIRKIDVPQMITSTSNKKSNGEVHTSTQIIIDSKNTEETNSLISRLFSRVQNCKIVVNSYNNCNVNKE